jgi:hypothetical protein
MSHTVVRSAVSDVAKGRSAFVVKGEEVAEGEDTTFSQHVENH